MGGCGHAPGRARSTRSASAERRCTLHSADVPSSGVDEQLLHARALAAPRSVRGRRGCLLGGCASPRARFPRRSAPRHSPRGCQHRGAESYTGRVLGQASAHAVGCRPLAGARRRDDRARAPRNLRGRETVPGGPQTAATNARWRGPCKRSEEGGAGCAGGAGCERGEGGGSAAGAGGRGAGGAWQERALLVRARQGLPRSVARHAPRPRSLGPAPTPPPPPRRPAGDGGAGQRGLAARPADHVGLGRQRGGTPAETTARPGPGGTRVNKPASLPLPWAGTNTSALGEQEQDTSTKLGYDFAVLPGLSSRFGVTGLPAQPF
mmetsp:Transcript_43969/g.103556  ORF Transcript_43969/g.103556 Transcript_43969/m.103556 type:complete len:321 (+) Transcript_43969:222-1184(+)